MAGLTVSGLSAGYGRRAVLSGIDLPLVERGLMTSMIGPNAAGKSTFLKAVAGLIGYSGAVAVDGKPIDGASAAERALRVAYLPQSAPGAAALTVYESILTARCATRIGNARDTAAVDAMVEELAIGDIAFRYLDALSGGQRQLVGLAQVLVRSPDVLLLDEPTSALDLHRQVAVLEIVRKIAAERGIVAMLAMHDLNLAVRFCDSVVVLAGGKVAASGAPAAVIDGDLLGRVYGVSARVERCSRGMPMIIVDGAGTRPGMA